MNKKRLASLIVNRIAGEITEEEGIELNAWIALHPANKDFLDHVLNEEQLEIELALWGSIDPAKGHAKWMTYAQAHRKARIRRISGWSIAASFLIALTVVGLLSRSKPANHLVSVMAGATSPVLPGRNTATITLSDGQQILLDSAGNGILAKQGEVQLVKTDDKSISYAAGKDSKGTVGVLYNMLSTPRSGQFQLVLPDGTHVWLNNASSLKYPIAFQGKDRSVELTGEAYFEVAKDATRPFFVKVKDETVEVLGTSFNIMAYEEEGGTRTTLLSGAVRVSTEKNSVQLKQDEQSRVDGKTELKVLKDMPSQDIVSWKNGFFYFGRASLKEVMRQLARWYDVDVVYKGNVPDVEFGGKIDRNLPLNELLSFLDKNQVHFQLEGRKIIVLP